MFRTITKHILKEQNKNLIAENLLLKEQILKQEAIINKQALKIDELETRLNHLENIQSKDSTNSSKPPSTDGFKRTVSMRSKSGKSVGGQKGHPDIITQWWKRQIDMKFIALVNVVVADKI